MGFNPLLAPYTINGVWTHDPAADEVFTLFRFPAAGLVHGAYATNTAAVHAEGGGTNFIALYLEHYSSAATPVLLGTVGSWSSATWAVDVPRAMTMAAYGSTVLCSSGQWLRLKYDESDLGVWTEMGWQVDYALSRQNGEPPTAGTGPA